MEVIINKYRLVNENGKDHAPIVKLPTFIGQTYRGILIEFGAYKVTYKDCNVPIDETEMINELSSDYFFDVYLKPEESKSRMNHL